MTISTGLFVFLFVLELLGMFFFYLFMRSRFSRERLLADVRAEVDKLIIDLGREADRDVALLESRILNLRSLMDEADRRIVLAGRETAKRRDAEDIAAALGSARPADSVDISAAAVRPAPPPKVQQQAPVQVPQPVQVQQAPPQVQPAPPQVQQPVQVQPKLQSTTAGDEPITVYTRPVVRRSETRIEPVIPMQERVLDMARRNISTEMIASTMSISLGEVELIIAMNSSSL